MEKKNITISNHGFFGQLTQLSFYGENISQQRQTRFATELIKPKSENNQIVLIVNRKTSRRLDVPDSPQSELTWFSFVKIFKDIEHPRSNVMTRIQKVL